ncbi:hypothetical protein Tco_0182228, partial [Tanacetum coccineum]
STLVQKVNSLETGLKAHKKLFKDVTKEESKPVDLDALIALANAAVTVDSIPIFPSCGHSNNPTAIPKNSSGVPTDVNFAPAHSTSPSKDPFKGKGVAEPSSPVSKRTKKQLADERLSEMKLPD